MPRQKSLVTVIRDMVKAEVSQAIQSLLGAVGAKKKTRRRRRRRRGPGRPPKRQGGRRASAAQ